MEKYAVEIDKELEKTATSRACCPKCGRCFIYGGQVPLCSKCGTEPFEKKKDDGKNSDS